MKVWFCKIGEADPYDVPQGGDAPMRDAIERAYRRVVGQEPAFTFSGWGTYLTESERAVVENRLPDRAKVTREVPYDVTDEMIDRGVCALLDMRPTSRPDHAAPVLLARREAEAVLRAALEPVDVAA